MALPVGQRLELADLGLQQVAAPALVRQLACAHSKLATHVGECFQLDIPLLDLAPHCVQLARERWVRPCHRAFLVHAAAGLDPLQLFEARPIVRVGQVEGKAVRG